MLLLTMYASMWSVRIPSRRHRRGTAGEWQARAAAESAAPESKTAAARSCLHTAHMC